MKKKFKIGCKTRKILSEYVQFKIPMQPENTDKNFDAV